MSSSCSQLRMLILTCRFISIELGMNSEMQASLQLASWSVGQLVDAINNLPAANFH